jgi:hypothetical protein
MMHQGYTRDIMGRQWEDKGMQRDAKGCKGDARIYNDDER